MATYSYSVYMPINTYVASNVFASRKIYSVETVLTCHIKHFLSQSVLCGVEACVYDTVI